MSYIEKTVNILKKIFLGIIFYIFILSVFKPYETYVTYKDAHNLKSSVLILGLIICIMIFLKMLNIIKKMSKKNIIFSTIIIGAILIVLQLLYIYNFRYIVYSDLSEVHKSAIQLVENGQILENNYLNRYTNNIPITLFWGLIYKVFSIIGFCDYKLIGIIINMISVDLFIFILCLFIKKKYNIERMLLVLLFIVVNPMFYVYLPTYYTNTMSLIFYISLIYIYYVFTKNDFKVIYLIYIGLIASVGIKIRVTVGIVLIAILIHLIKNNKFKEYIKWMGIILITVVVGIGAYNVTERQYIKFDYSQTKYPITHWLMMGSKGYGGYNSEDVAFTASFDKYEEKVKATTMEFGKRVLTNGIGGNLETITNKVNRVWCSGTYGFRQNVNSVENFNSLYPYIMGERSKLFNYYCQIMHITLLFLTLIYGYREVKNRNVEINSIFQLIILGGFVFYIFWEANSRYALMFLPFFILLGLKGLYILNEASNDVCRIKIEKVNKVINIGCEQLNKGIQNIKILIFCIIILMFACNYNAYTKTNMDTYNWSINQYQSNGKTQKINNGTIIEQTFKTDKPYNTLELKANINNEVKGNYIIKLMDNSNSKELYSNTISAEQLLKNKGNIKLEFDLIKSARESEYLIQFYKDNIDDEGVTLNKYYKENYDVVPNGNLKINGNEIDGDLMFKVYNKSKTSFMYPGQYICLVVFICFICMIGLFCNRRNQK